MKNQGLMHGETAALCRELSLLLHAGLGLSEGLFLLSEEETERRSLLEEMGRCAESGTALADAMERSGAFPLYVCRMVRVGERTGHLEEALEQLAEYYEERAEVDHRLRSAVTYPALLLLMILAVVAVLLVKVLPVFDEVYATLGGRLTGFAGGLLRLGEGLAGVLPLVLAVFAAALLAVVLFAVHEPFRRRALLLWQQKRGSRGLAGKLAQAHFAEALTMALGSGLPLEEAVGLAGELLEEQPELAARAKVCVERLSAGAGLGETLGETGLLPASACRMLTLGMRSGNGDRVCGEVARGLAEEARRELEKKVGQAEPAMVLAGSLLVGAVLLAVMLPLLHIISAIG